MAYPQKRAIRATDRKPERKPGNAGPGTEIAAMARREAPALPKGNAARRKTGAPLGAPSPRHFAGDKEREDGLPGAAKNTGDQTRRRYGGNGRRVPRGSAANLHPPLHVMAPPGDVSVLFPAASYGPAIIPGRIEAAVSPSEIAATGVPCRRTKPKALLRGVGRRREPECAAKNDSRCQRDANLSDRNGHEKPPIVATICKRRLIASAPARLAGAEPVGS
jgi:hypothetical protein